MQRTFTAKLICLTAVLFATLPAAAGATVAATSHRPGAVMSRALENVQSIFAPCAMARVWRAFPQLKGEWLQGADAFVEFDPARIVALKVGDSFTVPSVKGAQMVAVIDQVTLQRGERVLRGHVANSPRPDRFTLRLSPARNTLAGWFERQGKIHILAGRHGSAWIHAGAVDPARVVR
ncbi:MAG TPA: hypothetical protein VM687_15255 [Stenotrophomonas sp.]|nr:hypothetical protein [Stenotrophomonas sp.]